MLLSQGLDLNRAHYFHLQKIHICPAEALEIPSCKHLVSGAAPAEHDQPAVLRPPTSAVQTSDPKTLQ